MNRKTYKILSILIPALLISAFTVLLGCSSNSAAEPDNRRAFAKRIELSSLVIDKLDPLNDDPCDWKMIFLPTAGEMYVEVFIDHAKEIFGVEASVYDRFGILIKSGKDLEIDKENGNTKLPLKAFTPEAGLHYIKVSASSGSSVYSIRVTLDTREEVFVPPKNPPTYEPYVPSAFDDDSDDSDAGSGQTNNGNSGGGALPTDASGGLVLPTAPVGGIVTPTPGGSTTTVVEDHSSSSSKSTSNGTKTIEQKTTPVTTEAKAVKPICNDIKGNYTTIEAEILNVTAKQSGAQIKLDKGKKHGVKEGSVGEIYVNGKILEGGRFKVVTIFETSLQAETNASVDDVNKASKFVVKSPE